MASGPARARLLWAFLSLVLPVTFGHTSPCRSPALIFSAVIHFAMKRSASCSTALHHSPLFWAAVVHWSALIPKALRSSRKHSIHSFSWPPTQLAPPTNSPNITHFGSLVSRMICGTHGRCETAEVHDIRRTGGGRGLCGGPEKRVDGVFPGRPQRFRHQRRPVDDCIPGRTEMAQDGGTRIGTFHGEMDRCRGKQDWITAWIVCPNVTGRTKERIAQSRCARAGSLATVDFCVPMPYCLCLTLRFFFVVFSFVSVLLASIKSAVVVSFRCLLGDGDVAFFEYYAPLSFPCCMESTLNVFLTDGVFYLLTTGWSLTSAHVRIQFKNKQTWL